MASLSGDHAIGPEVTGGQVTLTVPYRRLPPLTVVSYPESFQSIGYTRPHSLHFASFIPSGMTARLAHPGHTRCGCRTTLHPLGRWPRISRSPLGTRIST